MAGLLDELTQYLAPAGYTPSGPTLNDLIAHIGQGGGAPSLDTSNAPFGGSSSPTLTKLDSSVAPAGYTPPDPTGLNINGMGGGAPFSADTTGAPGPLLGGPPPGGGAPAAPPPNDIPPGGTPQPDTSPPDAGPLPGSTSMDAPQLKGLLDPGSLNLNGQPGSPPSDYQSGLTNPAPSQPPQGFLSRLMQPEPSGITFRDKLMALGSIMKGDSKGAQDYLENQQTKAMALRKEQLAQSIRASSLAALKGAIDPVTGQVNFAKYVSALPAGGDPTEGLNVLKETRPKYTPVTPRGNEGAGVVNEYSGDYKQVIAPTPTAPKPPGKLILKTPDADPSDPASWVPNPAWSQQVENDAAARRKGAPPVGRAAGAKPKSYAEHEVNWGG